MQILSDCGQNTMLDEELLRYSRHLLLPEFDITGQERLKQSHVLLIGLGGLGSAVALYLAASGIGHLTLVDFDVVDLSNLQRQIIHRTADIGRLKVASARDALHALNPLVKTTLVPQRLNAGELLAHVKQADVVVDACDNLPTRLAINAACVKSAKPLVSGAVIRMEGQVFVQEPNSDSGCYNCFYREHVTVPETCAETGVLAPVVGIIGSLQATETIKVLTNIGQPLNGRLLLLDALRMEWRILKLRRWAACPTCGVSSET